MTATLRILAGAAVAATALTLSACSSSGDSSGPAQQAPSSESSMSHSAAAATRSGSFAGLNGKKVSGKVTVAMDSIQLSGYSSDEGPDLHIYLTNGTDEAAVGKGKEIAKVTEDGTQNFSLSGIEPSMYHDVVIHCDKAKAVFGAATLM